VASQTKLHLERELRDTLAGLVDFFAGRGVETYAVGGFLRDALLARKGRDIDLLVGADPLSVGRELADSLGGHCFPLSEERRVARVILPERGVQVDLLPLPRDITADLWQRDYTIDAMAARLEEVGSGEVEVVDPTGGYADLRAGLVRVVREESFRQDPLRPLRGVRLAAATGFDIEAATAELIRRYASVVPEAAAERRRDELMRIMGCATAGRGVRLLNELGLLEHLLPEVAAARDVEQPKEHFWDVLNHSLEAVHSLDLILADEEPQDEPWRGLWREVWGQLAWWSEARAHFREEIVQGTPRLAVLKLCGLLHDVAKPETKSFDETGRMRFFGHAEVGAETAGQVMRRFRFSVREVELVERMVRAHLRPVQMAQQGPPTRRALYRYFRDCGDAGIDTLFLSLADHLATAGPRVNSEGWRQHVALVNYILVTRLQEEAVLVPPRLMRGEELMAELGLSPGPLVGELLELIREAQAAGEIKTREEALAVARKALSAEGARVAGGPGEIGR
jgi:poly(A) polymerase